jgi:hypothetical protein
MPYRVSILGLQCVNRKVSGYTMTKSRRIMIVLITAVALCILSAALIPFFFWEAPRSVRNQYSAVHNMQTLKLAEGEYAAKYPDAGYACNLSDFAETRAESPNGYGLVDEVLSSGKWSGYLFEIHCPQGNPQKATQYMITAVPVEPQVSGKYAFCSDQGGEIWYSESGSVTECVAMRKPIEQEIR